MEAHLTLGIGYQGADFAVLAADSLGFAPGMLPVIDEKISTVGDRIAYVLSGKLPVKPPPSLYQDSMMMAARQLREWVTPVNWQHFDPAIGTALYLLVAGGPVGRSPSLVAIESFGTPRLAAIGDLFVIGCEAALARQQAVERNYGDLSPREASRLLIEVADALTDNMYAEMAGNGCRTVTEFVGRLGYFPAIGRPFRIALIDQHNPLTITEHIE